MKKRLLSLLLAVGMMLSLFPVSAFAEGVAEPTTKKVSTAAEFKKAVEEINGADSGSFVISLQKDIDLPNNEDITLSKNTTTLLGNGKTLSGGKTQTLGVSGSAVLNLGSEIGSDTLILDNEKKAGGIASVRVSGTATLNMYNGVTIQNYTYSGVRVGAGATFEMHGGTIQNCSSTKNGGGVAVNGSKTAGVQDPNSAVFIMSGGTISGCNAAANGGGVMAEFAECTISGGSIKNCSAIQGGGIDFEDGKLLAMSGGTISGCSASSSSYVGGGGIAITNNVGGIGMDFTGGRIENNHADNANGGGICAMSMGNFTAEAVNGLTITGNSALNGGGIYIMNMGANIGVGQEGCVDMSSAANILCNNTAGDAGDDIYLGGGSIKLPAAAAMSTTKHKIDGWYVDGMNGTACGRYTPNENGKAQDVSNALYGPIALVASYKRVRHNITMPAPNTYTAGAKNEKGESITSSLEDEKVYLSYDASSLNETETFEGWNVTAEGGASVKVEQDTSGRYYFVMPESDVSVTLNVRSAGEEPGTPAEPSGPADVTGSIVAGAALGAAGYYAGTGLYLNAVFGYVPANRQALASALWEKAGKPEPQSTALYTDVDEQDTDAQKADRWCVEQGLLPDKGEDTFKPAGWVTHTRCIVSWKKLEKLLQESAA